MRRQIEEVEQVMARHERDPLRRWAQAVGRFGDVLANLSTMCCCGHRLSQHEGPGRRCTKCVCPGGFCNPLPEDYPESCVGELDQRDFDDYVDDREFDTTGDPDAESDWDKRAEMERNIHER